MVQTYKSIRKAIRPRERNGKIMKTLAIIIIALAMTSCTKYKFHFGKACTPGNQEWSYVWFIEKDGTVNVTKENCTV